MDDFYYVCHRCKIPITKDTGDHWLGFHSETCKHWCNICFPMIEEWVNQQNENKRLDELHKKQLEDFIKIQERKEKKLVKSQTRLPKYFGW